MAPAPISGLLSSTAPSWWLGAQRHELGEKTKTTFSPRTRCKCQYAGGLFWAMAQGPEAGVGWYRRVCALFLHVCRCRTFVTRLKPQTYPLNEGANKQWWTMGLQVSPLSSPFVFFHKSSVPQWNEMVLKDCKVDLLNCRSSIWVCVKAGPRMVGVFFWFLLFRFEKDTRKAHSIFTLMFLSGQISRARDPLKAAWSQLAAKGSKSVGCLNFLCACGIG